MGSSSGNYNHFFKDIPQQILNANSIIVYSDGQYVIISEAIFKIIKVMGGIFYIFFIFKILPIKLRDRLYNFIANNRYRLFGKRMNCYHPPQK